MSAYGRRLLVGVIEEEAQNHPDRIFAWIPASSDLQDGFCQVTFKQVKTAVDNTVNWLQDRLGMISSHETVSYIGIPDLRYNIFFYAALKLQLKVFLPSPRNPPATNASLFAQTRCETLVYSSELSSAVQALQQVSKSLCCLQIPSLSELLKAHSAPISYPVTFNQVRRDPILILHSSGSTGTPKPITMTHGTFAVLDNDRNFPKIPGRRNHDLTTWDFPAGSCLYAPFPPFHLAGFMNSIVVPVFTETVPIFGPPTRIPSGGVAAQILRSLNVKGCLLPPTIAAELYSEPDGPDLLKSLDVLCYAGGPLPDSIGNELVKHVALCQFYGCTEIGPVRQLFPPKEHWQFMKFHPLATFELQPVEDDSYELVVYANEETEDSLSLNHNFPGVREYRTKDLFKPHPSEPNLWRFYARRDDILVLSTGEKFNPVPLELSIETIPGIAGALIAGQGQPRVALLVELRPDHSFGTDPVEGLWPSLGPLNAKTASSGRISKSMILVADSKKPFIRAGKGTIVRKTTIAAYESELQELFEGRVKKPSQRRLLKPSVFCEDDVKYILRSIIEDTLDGQSVNDSENLYTQGLDSVKSLETVSQLKESLKLHHTEESLSWITPEVLYTYPSIDELTTVLLEWLNEGVHPRQLDRAAKMADLYNRYEKSVPTISASSQPWSDDSRKTLNVALVGSTGFLGQYLLSSLLQDPSVGRVICLNRSAIAQERFVAHLSANQIPAKDGWQNKVSFLQVDFTKPNFGLQESIYNELKDECDVIVHSAWQVNFVLPLDSFKDSFSGLLNSINLAAFSKRRPRFLFVSSISATGVFGERGLSDPKLVLEDAAKNPNEAMQTGYGESKYVAEQLVYAASSKSGVAASILRIGQIAPITPPTTISQKAIWPASDAAAALLRTCKTLQMVPSDFLEIDWLPVNVVVDLIQAIMHHDRFLTGKPPRFYNLVNPKPTPWAEISPTVQSWCGGQATAVVVKPLKDWIAALRAEMQRSPKYDQELLPAGLLLSFFGLFAERGPMNRYSQKNVLEVSRNNVDFEPVDAKLFRLWVEALP